MELELMKSKSAEDSAKSEVESLTNVKECLKNKIREYKSRLEAYVAKCDELKQVLKKLIFKLFF